MKLEITTATIDKANELRTLSALDPKPYPFLTAEGLELVAWGGVIIPKSLSLLIVGEVWCKCIPSPGMYRKAMCGYLELYEQHGAQLGMVDLTFKSQDLNEHAARSAFAHIAGKVGARTSGAYTPKPQLKATAEAIPASEVLGWHLRQNLLQV